MKKVPRGCCSMRTVNVRWGLVGLVGRALLSNLVKGSKRVGLDSA